MTKISKKVGQAQKAAQPTKVTVDLETITPHSSSPASKISRMKAKNALAETKSAQKKIQKRRIEDAVALDVGEEQPNKKARTDVEDALQEKMTPEEEDTTADQPHTDASAHLPQKYGHRGRKGKASPAQQKSSIDWDQVPIESLGVDRTRQAETSPSKRTNPIKVPAKKENVEKPKDVSKVSAVDYSSRVYLLILFLNRLVGGCLIKP